MCAEFKDTMVRDIFSALSWDMAFEILGMSSHVKSVHFASEKAFVPKWKHAQRKDGLSNSSLPVFTKHIEQACLNSCVSAKGFFAKSTAAGRSLTSGIPTAIPIGVSLLFSWNRARSQINYTSGTESKLTMTKETINNTNLWSERTRGIIYILQQRKEVWMLNIKYPRYWSRRSAKRQKTAYLF